MNDFHSLCPYTFSMFKCCLSENIILTWKPTEITSGALKSFLLITNEIQWLIAIFLYNILSALKLHPKLHNEWATWDSPWRAVVVWVTHFLSPQRWSVSHPQYFQSHPSTKLLFPEQNISYSHMFFMCYGTNKSKAKQNPLHFSSIHKSKPKSRRNLYK